MSVRICLVPCKITGEERSDPCRLTYEAKGKDAELCQYSAGMPAWNGLSAGVWHCLCTPQEPKERGLVWAQDCADVPVVVVRMPVSCD